MSDIDINKIRRLDGGLLLVFHELLRLRRASAVADRLGLSQSAISHALTRLRDLFDDQLFVRRPHGFEPTRRALELGPQIEELITLTGEALTPNARFDPAQSTRLFRVAAPEFVTDLIAGALINRLRERAPNASFAVGHATEEEAYKGLRQGEADIALGRFGASRPGFVTEPLFDDVYCVVARRGHPTVGKGLSLEAWRDTGHVYAWSKSETGGDVSDPHSQVAMRAAVPQWLSVLMLVASTDAIGTVPRRLAERHADILGLQVIDPPFEPNRIHVSALRRAGVQDAGLDWFLGEVLAVIGG